MKIDVGIVQVDPILLLMHEPNDPLAEPPLDEYVLERILNDWLVTHCPDDLFYLRFVPPRDSGLSRWSLEWHAYEDEHLTRWSAPRGLRRPKTIREALPRSIMSAIRALSHSSITSKSKEKHDG